MYVIFSVNLKFLFKKIILAIIQQYMSKVLVILVATLRKLCPNGLKFLLFENNNKITPLQTPMKD